MAANILLIFQVGVFLLMMVVFSLKTEEFFSSEMSISSLDLLRESAGKFRIHFLMSKMQIEEGGVLKSFQMTFLQKAKFSLKLVVGKKRGKQS